MKNVTRLLFAVLALGSISFAAMNGPTGLRSTPTATLYVANFNSNTVQVYNSSHQLVSTITGPTSGLNKPYGLAIDTFGNLHVANFGNGTITRYDATCKLYNTIKGLVQPIYLTIDELGTTWVVDKNLTRLAAWDINHVKVRSISASNSKLYSSYYGVAGRYGLLFVATNGTTDTLYTGVTAETLGQGKSIRRFRLRSTAHRARWRSAAPLTSGSQLCRAASTRPTISVVLSFSPSCNTPRQA